MWMRSPSLWRRCWTRAPLGTVKRPAWKAGKGSAESLIFQTAECHLLNLDGTREPSGVNVSTLNKWPAWRHVPASPLGLPNQIFGWLNINTSGQLFLLKMAQFLWGRLCEMGKENNNALCFLILYFWNIHIFLDIVITESMICFDKEN